MLGLDANGRGRHCSSYFGDVESVLSVAPVRARLGGEGGGHGSTHPPIHARVIGRPHVVTNFNLISCNIY